MESETGFRTAGFGLARKRLSLVTDPSSPTHLIRLLLARLVGP